MSALDRDRVRTGLPPHRGGPFEDDLNATERAWDELLRARGYDGRARIKAPPPPPPPPPPPVAPLAPAPIAPPDFAIPKATFRFRVSNWRRMLPDWTVAPRRVGRRLPPLSSVQVAHVIEAVQKVFGVSVKDLMSVRRARAIAWPRQAAYALAAELTSESYPKIGREFGGRDHTTIMHGCKAAERRRLEDPAYAAAIDAAREDALRRARGGTP